MKYSKFEDSQFMSALKNRSDLDVFNENKGAVFALELFFGIEDILNTISPAVTGGSDDAKTDLLFVNRDDGAIVLVQAYEAQNFKLSAKGNKGADLSYAINVLLTCSESDIPAGILPQVSEARSALRDGDINMVHIWYLHNCPESEQIKGQMLPLTSQAIALLEPYQKEGLKIQASVREIGLESLDVFYRSSKQAIIIDKEIVFSEPRLGFNLTQSNWSSFITTVSGQWLASLYREHNKNELFSANVRGFMGANKKDNDKVINSGIQESAGSSPNDFFVFNNGITALVHDFTLDPNNPNLIKSIRGISIVNGAQTTGSLGSISSEINLDNINVGVRFIKCGDKSKVESITRFNNSQNKVIQSDFRANDSIQSRLRDEFLHVKCGEYNGGLRGSTSSDRRLKIDAHSAAQALMAWHGNPADSYHRKMAIWEEDDLYQVAFDPSIRARHIAFVYTLLEAASLLKDELRNKIKLGNAQAIDKEIHDFLNERGAGFLVIHAMSKIIEIILEDNVKSPYGIGFKDNLTRDVCIAHWKNLIMKLSHQIKNLGDGLKNRLSNKGEIERVVNSFSSSFGTVFLAIKSSSPANPYKDFVSAIRNDL